MTVGDIYDKYSKKISEYKTIVHKEERKELLEFLESKNLNSMVRNKKTGSIGKLKIERTSLRVNDISFYPLKKNGLEEILKPICDWLNKIIKGER